MCLDETGSTTNLLRRYGRAPRGARVHDHAPCGRWQTSTFLAALRVTGLTAPGVFDGAIDGESFRAYIEQILVPTLQPGDIVIAYLLVICPRGYAATLHPNTGRLSGTTR